MYYFHDYVKPGIHYVIHEDLQVLNSWAQKNTTDDMNHHH